jgi:uncharacterized phage-associated protein
MCIHLPFQHKKATQALNYFARLEGGSVNKMKALKLIFFADRYHLRKYGRPITNGEYWAMDRGPVNSGVKDIAEMSGFLGQEECSYASRFIEPDGKYDVKSLASVESRVFSETDLESLKFSWETFGHLNQFELADITHEYPEWKKHKRALENCPRVLMDYSDFVDDPEQGFEQCCSLSAEERQDRLDEMREMSKVNALLS